MNYEENPACPICGEHIWVNVDNPTEYIRTCSNCLYTIVICKTNYINKSKCTRRNSLTGELEEK